MRLRPSQKKDPIGVILVFVYAVYLLSCSVNFVSPVVDPGDEVEPTPEPAPSASGSCDGGSDPVDGICTASEHRIFVSSTGSNGDLVTTGGGADGLSSGDNICASDASSGGLTLTYKAILSDSSTDAKDRITVVGKTYVFTDANTRRRVVNDQDDLWDGSWDSQADYDPSYNQFQGGIFTGTELDGTSGSHCMSWTSSSMADLATSGSTNATLTDTVEHQAGSCMTSGARLYCINQ